MKPTISKLLIVGVAVGALLFYAVFSRLPNQVSADITSNLSSLWQFSEGSGTSTTPSATLNNFSCATINCNAQSGWTSSGRIGNGLRFDGTDDYVQTANNDLVAANNFTISTWFKADAIPAAGGIMLWQGQSGGNGWGSENEMHLAAGSVDAVNRLSFFYGTDTTSSGTIYINIPLADTTNWNHVAVVVSNSGTDSASALLYLNGSLQASDTGNAVSTNKSSWANGLVIGRPGTSSRLFDGALDDIRVYTRALSSSDVTELYNSVSGGGVPPPPPPPPPTGDTTPPTVSITSPTNGASVSGSSVSITASASDNVGIAGVQFRLDGSNLSSEDTTSPYTISWNATQTTSGSHTLTAVARDSAGNTTTSSSVSVTVNSTVPPPPPPGGGISYYVDGSCSNNGNGRADQCASSSGGAGAYRDPQSCFSAVRAGDICYIKNGTYVTNNDTSEHWDNAGFIIGASGTASSRITIRNYPGHSPLLTNCPVSQTTYCNHITISGRLRSYITIEGLRIHGGLRLDGADRPNFGHGIIIRNNEFTEGFGMNEGNLAAIRLDQHQGALIQNNYIHDLSGFGGESSGGCIKMFHNTDAIVEYNTCRDVVIPETQAGGIDDKAEATRNIHRYNLIQNTNNCFRLNNQFTSSGVQIYGNVCIGKGIDAGVKILETVTSVDVYNNTFYNYAVGSYVSGVDGGGVSGVRMYNNIFNQLSGGTHNIESYNYAVNQANPFSLSNYNRYITGDLYRVGGSNLTSLTLLQGTGRDINSSEGNCNFVNPGVDFHLQSNSPCRSNGANAGRVGGALTGAAIELGAYGVASCVGHTCGSTTPPPPPPVVPPPPPANLPPVGTFDEIRLSDGVVRAWSYDPNATSTSNQIHIYIDGPAGTGSLLGGFTTNILRSDVNSSLGISGNHGIEYTIPSQFRNGVQHSIYLYGIDTSSPSTSVLLTGSPRTFTLGGATPPPPPAGSTTYYSTNFNDGTTGPLGVYANGGGTCTASTTFTDPGSARSMRCTVPAGSSGTAALQAWFGNGSLASFPKDPTLDQDFYQQTRFIIGSGALTSIGGAGCTSQNSGAQFKTHKSVYGQVGSNVNGWVMTNISPCGNANQGLITEPELWTNSLSPNRAFSSDPYPYFVEGKIYDVVYYYRRNSGQNCGVSKMWVNGSQIYSTSCLSFLGSGGGQSSAGLVLWDGATYTQSTLGTFTVYNLFTRATNFPIGAAAGTGTPVAGDINLDHIVNSIDYSLLNSDWFTSNARSDLNSDGIVNAIDYSVLNANWFRTW